MNRRPLSPRFPRGLLIIGLLLWPLLLTACGSGGDGALLSGVTTEAGQLDLAAGVNQLDAVGIDYQIGKEAKASISLQGPDGKSYTLRQDEARSPGSYSFRFDGAIETQENGLPQTRVLPNGEYHYTVQATSGSQTAQSQGRFTIRNSPTEALPQIEGLSVDPAVISPNFDARDDVAQIGWRTTRPATVTVSVAGANGFSKILKSAKNQPAQEDKIVFNGLDQTGNPLADGVYTYTIEAADQWGNVTRRASTVEIKGGGRPQATIVQATIAPTEIIQGNLVTVTVRVRNTGKVPIRTHGPDSGYVYSTRDVFSSIEDEKAGFWRIGVDYESNSGGGPSRYPFRWGFGHELQPGEEVEVVGVIKVDKQEEKLKFYVGLIQEQISLVQDRIQITQVKISY